MSDWKDWKSHCGWYQILYVRQLEHPPVTGFTAPLLGEKHIYEAMSVKGEQGGSGGGVKDERKTEGEMWARECERGRWMHMQRVELSIRLRSLSSFLSCSLFLQFPLIHWSQFGGSSAVNSSLSPQFEVILWTAAFLRTFLDYPPSLSGATGAVCRLQRALSISPPVLWEWWGGSGIGSWMRVGPSVLSHSTSWEGGPSKRVGGGREAWGRGVSERTRGGEAPAGRRMVMPAPRAPVVLLLCRLRVIQARPCLSSTWASQEGCPALCSTAL